MALSVDTQTFLLDRIERAHDAIRQGRHAGVIPNGYQNFDLAASVLQEARQAFTNNPEASRDAPTAARLLGNGITALQLWNAGPAAESVKTAIDHLQAVVDVLNRQA
jgi:hypothetical protein